MESRNAASERCSRAVGAAHGLDVTLFFTLTVGSNIYMSYAVCHAVIQHLYEIVDFFILIHDDPPELLFFYHTSRFHRHAWRNFELFVKVNLDVACKYLILFTKSSGDDGEGIGDTILCIIERKLGYR